MAAENVTDARFLNPRLSAAAKRTAPLLRGAGATATGDPPVLRELSATQRVSIAAAGLAAVSQHDGEHDSPAEAVAAAEAVSISRGALYQCLIDLGWMPPHGVAEGMRLDQRLVREGLGACYDGVPARKARARSANPPTSKFDHMLLGSAP
jgi:hypothetical protein